MIDAHDCKIELKLVEKGGIVKAYVTFHQDQTRFSGFMIKNGAHGLWLEPPSTKSGIKWFKLYYDQDKERFKELQNATIKEYERIMNHASPEDIVKDGEINLDEIRF